MQKAAPASRYKPVPAFGDLIPKFGAAFTFPSGKRLEQSGVLVVLKSGKRLGRADFECRFCFPESDVFAEDSKVAISVPKRLLKSSVARNRIKRLVREVYRTHQVARTPLLMLVNFKARKDGRDTKMRRQLRIELTSMFDTVVQRAPSGKPNKQAN